MIRKYFIVIFCFILMLPLIFIDLSENKISVSENRQLTNFPNLIEENKINLSFLDDFDTWFNEHIGFRDTVLKTDAQIQYYLFDEISDENYKFGQNQQLNYVGEKVLSNYQHNNLYTSDQLEQIANSFSEINAYLNNKGIQFYYMQCRDKQSIYPEYFPKTVNQYGAISCCDQVVNKLRNSTSIPIIDTKSILLENKNQYEVYSKSGDVTHWTNRGAFFGYQQLMDKINSTSSSKYKILEESDYDTTPVDMGTTLLGDIHLANMSEAFSLKNPKAILTSEKLTIDADDPRCVYYTNNYINNNIKVLILGDSYIQSFIIDDLAESFYETGLIWKQNIADLVNIVDLYKPDMIIYEQAERELDFEPIINARNSID